MSVARRRFRFIKEIAEGGFGKVYLAEQLSSDGFSRIVAVKLLHAKWSSHDEVVMRTRDEARLLGLIRHQNIVKVEDLTSIDGKCAIVMEYLEGVDLKWMSTYLGDKGRDFPRAALFEILLQVASALDAAYNGIPLQGGDPLRVIHRDIKPSNVFVTVAGQIKVLDFGTARANFAEREAKTQALAFGSQGYMAPERMLGEEDTPAADVFSLGVTLWELLTLESFGRIPPRPNKFAQKVEERIEALHLEGDPEWRDQVREVLRLMLSYEPSERPTAAQIVDIFDILASDAQDMGLRRFCRTLVAEAKANEPEIDTGDPLTGQVVDEDVSSAFGMGSAGLQPFAQDPLDAEALGQQGASGASSEASGPVSGPHSLPPDEAQASGPPTPAPAPASAPPSSPPSAPRSTPPTDAGAERRGGGRAMVAVIGLGALLLGLLAAVVAAVVAFMVIRNGDPQPPTGPEPAPVAEPAPAPEGPEGCAVLAESAREGVDRVPTVLTVDGTVREVTLSGSFGFRAEWDGEGECDVGELPEGRYRATVTPASGSKIRGRSFEVDGGADRCSFTFDVAAKDWTGSCE